MSPISPANKALYPSDWATIRNRILTRAFHRCEACGLANHLRGWRLPSGAFVFVLPVEELAPPIAKEGEAL